MKVIRTVAGMSACARATVLSGQRIGLVPTMGYLHDGHISLFREARHRADVVVVSLFVNPTQFGPGEDLSSYPRDFGKDCRICERERVDVLFYPETGDMYCADASVAVEETKLSAGLCGAFRPGHFRGVATVVAKLFNITLPNIAVFGQKDAQQAAVIRRLVRDLNFPVEVVVAPIVREPDGLAMSSRNVYLSAPEREAALELSRSLEDARAAYAAGELSAERLRARMLGRLSSNRLLAPEYVEVVDGNTLERVSSAVPGTLIALAVRVGRTRLIDNAILGP